MTASIRRKIERFLYGRGFSSPVVRGLLCAQICLTALTLCAGAALLPLTPWVLCFGAGAAVALYNFWHIARSAQANIVREFSMALGLKSFAGFFARLTLTAFVLFALIVWLRAPVAPLVAGLTSTVAIIAVWGISRLARKPVKEA